MDVFEDLQNLYQGFWIEDPVGNNAFSYKERRCQRIYVPPLMVGTIRDVAEGTEPAFVEVIDGREAVCQGLKNFIRFSWQDKEVCIFDNHNHAFCFWVYGLMSGKIPRKAVLIHADQHKDTRQPPEEFFMADNPAQVSLLEAFQYTNFILNVGNFIPPAKKAGIFKEIIQINGLDQMKTVSCEKPFVLDIDLDWFSKEMDYIPLEEKCVFLRNVMKDACFITVATSPYFIDFQRALCAMKSIFSLE